MPKEATDGSEKAIQEKNKQTNKQEMMGEGEGEGGGAAERKVPKHDYLTLRAPISISEIRFLV